MIGFICFWWLIVGCVIQIMWSINSRYFDGFEVCNPYWTYTCYEVNWFGACIVSLFYTALCPITSICYWFYKLCTIGRS